MTGSSYDVATMKAGNAVPWGDSSSDSVGLAFTGTGACVAVARVTPTTADAGAAGELRFAVWSGGWSPGFGSPWMPLQSTPTLTINGGPSVAGSSLRAHAAYQGTDMKFYYAEYGNSAWSPANEPMTAGTAAQSAGPAPPAIVTLHDTPIVAFVGNDGNVYDQTRASGTWGPANGHGVAGQCASITPSIVALTRGPELLLVYANVAGNTLSYTTRTGGVWSTPATIAGTETTAAVSLAPIAAGGAVLSYMGTDMHLYTTVLSASASSTWSSPVKGVPGDDPVLINAPSVATGATGADAELYYLETSPAFYEVFWSRMTNGAWGAPTMVGTANRVFIATGN
jgi:hypothetical protein